MSPERLIKDLKKGKKHAFDTLYESYASLFYTICLRYAKSTQEAEDLTQEAFIKIFDNLKKYRGEGSFEGWMKRIVVNTCLNAVRGKNIFTDDVETAVIESDNRLTESANVLDNLASEDIFFCINQLPLGFKTVFNLVVLEGYSHKEVAQELGISESASRSQLAKARVKLQSLVNQINSSAYERTGS